MVRRPRAARLPPQRRLAALPLTYRRQQLGFLRSREYFGDETDVQSRARVAAAEQMVRAHASVGALRPSTPSSLRNGALEAQKTVFTFFDNGEDALPPFLKCCVASWRVQNPGWRVVVLSLDRAQLGAFVDVEVDLPPTFWAIDRASLQADLLRLAVLARHGGIYVDVSTLCLQHGFADATWRQLETKAYVGYANVEYGQHCLCWFMPMRVKGDALIRAWHQQLMALFRERTSDKGVHADAYFDGVDLSGFISARDDHRDYLVINCVFSAILEKERELSGRWKAGAHTEPGTAPTAPTNWYTMDFWQPFEPLFEPPVTPTMPFYDMVDARMAKMAQEGDEPWVQQLADTFLHSGTPFVKFCRAGAHFQHLTTEALMVRSRCALARLVRHALSAS